MSSRVPEPGRSRCGGPQEDPRAGVILPAALLLLLGGTLMAASLLVTARSAVVLSSGDRRLAGALAYRSPLAGGGVDHAVASHEVRELSAGYVLIGSDVPDAAWSIWASGWRLEAHEVAARLRAAVETAGGVAGHGGEVVVAGGVDPEAEVDETCEDPAPLPEHWIHGGPRDPQPHPPLPPFPRLGPIGLEILLERADVLLVPGEGLPDREAVFVAVPDEVEVRQGWSSGLLVATGDLRLSGDARFTGLVLVGGDLVLEDAATVIGAARVGRELRFEGGGRVQGCRAEVREKLASVTSLAEPLPLPGGAFLGRH